MDRFIHKISLQNFLSFGAKIQTLELLPLNILIGPNGSGKSNFLEAIEIFRTTTGDLTSLMREGGGTKEWLWKGSEQPPTAAISAVIDNPKGVQSLSYLLSFTVAGQRFEIIDERIENELPHGDKSNPLSFYQFNRGKPLLRPSKKKEQPVATANFDFERSILAQRRDPEIYPAITYLGDAFSSMRLYREWNFGRDTKARRPQSTDMPNVYLEKDASNLALVLNYLQGTPQTKIMLSEYLKKLYAAFDDYLVLIEGGTAQLVFQEKGKHSSIPATRLSDGTLRFLCLLAILLHPKPPRLICIEEPELGLHPDIIPVVAELLKDASTRMQIIVTTHSDILVDAMTDSPEAVVVVERHATGTVMQRLSQDTIEPFLEEYRLGQLWLSGQVGGTRW
jgi:Predicted ATPase